MTAPAGSSRRARRGPAPLAHDRDVGKSEREGALNVNAAFRIGCTALALAAGLAYILTRDPRAGTTAAAVRAVAAQERREADAFREARERADAERVRLAEDAERENMLGLLRRHDARLAALAWGQVSHSAESSGSCGAREWNETYRDERVVWWKIDYECPTGSGSLPDRTSVSVKLTKRGGEWTFD